MATTTQAVQAVIEWFDSHGRELPWRGAHATPWGILVSEVMLQQTQVDRVAPKWRAWMATWPTPSALAAAPTAEVLRAWQGLGYPRRALRLQAAARLIVDEWEGQVPTQEADLLALPGIGHYTAAAVCAFAYGQPTVVLDTNIRRVISRAWSGVAAPSVHVTKAERELATSLVASQTGARWSAAVMELGALVCTARNPLCDSCPLQDDCRWQESGKPANAPQRRQQPAFAGSDRQARGALLRTIGAAGVASVSMVEKAWTDAVQRERALTSLAGDGLIVRVREGYSLPA